MSIPADELAGALRGHLALYRELMSVVESEGQVLRQPEPASLFPSYSGRKALAPRLDRSLEELRRYRVEWTRALPDERARHPEVGALLRQCQEAVMRILVLDRENEQALLRRGLLAPRDLPRFNRQRPHFVADLYRRQGQS